MFITQDNHRNVYHFNRNTKDSMTPEVDLTRIINPPVLNNINNEIISLNPEGEGYNNIPNMESAPRRKNKYETEENKSQCSNIIINCDGSSRSEGHHLYFFGRKANHSTYVREASKEQGLIDDEIFKTKTGGRKYGLNTVRKRNNTRRGFFFHRHRKKVTGSFDNTGRHNLYFISRRGFEEGAENTVPETAETRRLPEPFAEIVEY